MTATGVIPDSHQDLLERPLYGHMATVRPDGTPQVNPTWYVWDGLHLSFTTSTVRRKYRNVLGQPDVALSVNDPDQPYRYREVRGVIERIEPDPAGTFFDLLARRYGMAYTPPIADVADRVVLRMRPSHATSQ